MAVAEALFAPDQAKGVSGAEVISAKPGDAEAIVKADDDTENVLFRLAALAWKAFANSPEVSCHLVSTSAISADLDWFSLIDSVDGPRAVTTTSLSVLAAGALAVGLRLRMRGFRGAGVPFVSPATAAGFPLVAVVSPAVSLALFAAASRRLISPSLRVCSMSPLWTVPAAATTLPSRSCRSPINPTCTWPVPMA